MEKATSLHNDICAADAAQTEPVRGLFVPARKARAAQRACGVPLAENRLLHLGRSISAFNMTAIHSGDFARYG